jgi:hypothetical protein
MINRREILNYKSLLKIMMIVLVIITSCFIWSCKEKIILTPEELFGNGGNVLVYPKVSIIDFFPDTAKIGSLIKLIGTNFSDISILKLGNMVIEDYILKADTVGHYDSKTQAKIYIDTIEFTLPRRSLRNTFLIEDIFGGNATLDKMIQPLYPYVTVTAYPIFIERERRFKLGSYNVDMIGAVRLVGKTTTVTLPVKEDNASPTEITVLTVGVTLPDTIVTLEFVPIDKSIRILIPSGGISTKKIPVIDPQPYDPVPPIVLWNFDEEPIFNNEDAQFGTAAVAGINLAKGVDSIRGNFYTVSLNRVPETPETPRGSSWAFLGRIEQTEMPDGTKPIDLSNFNEPYVTFLVNTNNHKGYFQFVVNTDDGVKYGTHGMFNFTFQNSGWEWKSFKFDDLRWERWSGEGPSKPAPNGAFEYMRFEYTTGDIPTGSYFEISVDEVMITDGPLMITDTLFLFEDGVNRFNANSTATSSVESKLNGSTVTAFEGAGYQTIKITNVAAQNETVGAVKYSGDYNEELKYFNAPHVSFWVNTGDKSSYLNVVAYEGDTRYVYNAGEVNTGGKWQLITTNIRAQAVKEDGSGGKINFGKLTAVSIEVNTGNAFKGAALEANIDYIVISEGPLY